MTFSESVEYLLSLGNEVSAMKLGLVNIRTLLDTLGRPQNNYFKVQVAGTNGKGSVCAFLDAICRSAGIKTGLYTSPHLISITERIKISGSNIGENRFANRATEVRSAAEHIFASGEIDSVPTFFEQMTAIGLLEFAKADVKLAILETGLGGRLDATTAAGAEIAAITQIAYDHQEFLGESLVEIAAEKAAIIRPASAVAVARQKTEALRAIAEACTAAGIEPRMTSEVATIGESGNLILESSVGRYGVGTLGLPGRHQIENAKVALLLAEMLNEHFRITPEDIIGGLQSAVHPGRLEFDGRFLFDGAHNTAGAEALRDFLEGSINRPVTFVFGTMKDKDVSGMAASLFPLARNIILTKAANSRSLPPAEITALVPAYFPLDRVYVTESVRDALETAAQIAAVDEIICVTGSLYLVGEAKKILNNKRTVQK